MVFSQIDNQIDEPYNTNNSDNRFINNLHFGIVYALSKALVNLSIDKYPYSEFPQH
ncbi:conserved hypothetical protein [Vibrio crassostreae]|uniref:Uncharacterized protein n=1 Tax=Vibrio crassostreae TaxID=246167 RepID=A0A822MPJ4_9VIBR|nr:conserved hypothetical protein [Vibrio crassostreae]CAK1843970.1 conserved hypothetical protein [Vibrio crassostreae]CAK1976616.1 conserved hypothetical protein [Vibrio crassostreae]CAK2045468.1 conserved hypothetical protein [Vibrio crassostreae]CAK2081116.1 conserved hypothetical protein [Vibrio crassostreae]